jgi:hypothetical protein
LTGRLTGYEVEIIKESEYRKMVEEQRGKEIPLDLLEGLSEAMISKLHAAGLKTVKEVLDQGEDGLLQIKGIGEKTAKRIWALISAREAGAESPEAKKTGPVETEEAQAAEASQEELEESEAPAVPVEMAGASPNGEVETAAEPSEEESRSPEEQPQAPEAAESAEATETAESAEKS